MNDRQPDSQLPAAPTSPTRKSGVGSNEAVHPLEPLRRFTPARIALGRTGDSLPTLELLDFSLAHALARDAVHASLDAKSIVMQLDAIGQKSLLVHSAAPDRATYLRRPDLGRRLSEAGRHRLSSLPSGPAPELAVVIADGLSALAPARYAIPVLQEFLPMLTGWRLAPIVIAEQARVAIGDEIGELLEAEIVVVLIGERPGLSSPDSLGIYLTYAPEIGRTDAERNCVSNVRQQGTPPERAARLLHYLLIKARRLKLSGVGLKDDSVFGPASLPAEAAPSPQRQIKST